MKNGEKSFGKLFDLIEQLAQSRHGMSGKELSEACAIPLSTTFRMLKFMVDNDYVRADRGIYTLGVGFVRFGNVACQQHPLIKAARPVLEELSRETRETVHLAKLQNDRILYIDKVEGSRPIHMGSLIGKRNPLYCTGVGKAILAFQPRAVQEKLLASIEYVPYTATTVPDEAAMREELARIRARGYAVDNCEHEAWVYCVAAPVLARNGQCVAGISISGAETYLRKTSEHLARLITAAAHQIAGNLQ